jgi:hypothetical protein
MEFHEAWHFLDTHHYFHDPRINAPNFKEALDIEVVKVNPINGEIDDDESKNTHTNVWLECGNYFKEDGYEGFCHDYNLDTGAMTFEQAIINLANIVKEKYGENPKGYGEISKEEQERMNKFFDELTQNK